VTTQAYNVTRQKAADPGDLQSLPAKKRQTLVTLTQQKEWKAWKFMTTESK
jgi:hypothetical protein